MGSTVQNVVQSGSIAEQRRVIQRVAESELFQKSPRLREFLLYVAECTLENHLSDVREQVIAQRVFGRDPETGGPDTIVRAEARNLRKRLELYFNSEGRDEPLLVLMPKGGYSLTFAVRSPAISTEEIEERHTELERADAADAFATAAPMREVVEQTRGFYRGLSWSLAVVAVLASALAIYWYEREVTLRGQLAPGPTTFPFAALFTDERETLIVTSDTGMLQIASLLHRPITLDEYIARSYPRNPETNPPNLLRNWNLYEFTDGREMVIAGLLLRRNAEFARRTSLLSGHAVQLQDFKDHNVILIGSPMSNPWAQLYEDRLNFRCGMTSEGRIVFRSSSAQQGGAKEYPDRTDIQHNRTYARLVFFPKSAEGSSVLLIAGTTAQSTQVAGELAADQVALARILRAAGVDPAGPPRFVEVLIRSSNFVGGAILPEVVAWHLASATER